MGWLVVDGQTQGFHCNLREYGEAGAQLTVSGLLGIPDTFSLFVEPDSIRYACRVLRRKGNSVEVEFTEAALNNRYRDFAARR